MPIYEYTCNDCSETFTLLQWKSIADETECPKCGSKDVRKNLSTFSCLLAGDVSYSSGGSSSGFSGGG